jgi:nicotinamidase-related amidase
MDKMGVLPVSVLGLAAVAVGCAAAEAPKTLRALYGIAPLQALPAEQTALVLVDVQQAFFAGPLALPGAPAALAQIEALLGWARSHGVRVIHVRQQGHPGALFDPASPESAERPEVASLPGEEVIYKRMAGAFTGTDLADTLRSSGIRAVILCGYMTHLAVDTSARDATVQGFTPIVVADATATRALPGPDGQIVPAAQVQAVALAALADRFAEVRTAAQIMTLPTSPSR